MRDDSFCRNPRQCPVQHKCARNTDNYSVLPPVRIYETFYWIENSGCDEYVDLSKKFTLQQKNQIPESE